MSSPRLIRSKSSFKTRYHSLKKIGSGSFGKVYSCISVKDDKEYAVKILSLKSLTRKQQNNIHKEIEILYKLNHKNIIKIHDFYKTDNHYYLILEYCNGGDLFKRLIKTKDNKLNEYESAFIIYKLTNAINYMHTHGVVHRDIKLDNVLLNGNGILKINDFGLSHNEDVHPHYHRMKSRVGTPFYAPPEIVLGEVYGPQVDYWSLGVILYILLTGEFPFFAESTRDLYLSIISKEPDISNDLFKNISQGAKDLIKGLLIKDPNKRYSYEKVINHPWIRKTLHFKKKTKKSNKSSCSVPSAPRKRTLV